MRFLRSICMSILVLLLAACSNFSLQRAGVVTPVHFKQTIPITTQKSVVVVPVEIDGESKQFLFDTGAQLTLLQRPQTEGMTSDVSGASQRSMELGNEVVSALKIGEQTFSRTHAWNGNFVGLKEQIQNFGGILGQSVINKANWLINSPEKTLTMSSDPIDIEGFSRISIILEEGIPHTYISVAGQSFKAVIDSGSSASLSIPPDHPLASVLLDQYKFEKREREIYTLGGLQTVTEKVAVIDAVKLGNLEFNQVFTDIRASSGLRLGMAFFKDTQVYIDNNNGEYQIKN